MLHPVNQQHHRNEWADIYYLNYFYLSLAKVLDIRMAGV